MPRRSGCRSNTSKVMDGVMTAQPRARNAIGHKAQKTSALNSKLAARLMQPATSSIKKPSRIWRLGVNLPALRPLSQAPIMMPLMVKINSQKNCVGASASNSPRKAGADNTYKNMPLKGTPLASAKRKKRGSEPSFQYPRIRCLTSNGWRCSRAKVSGSSL